MAIDRDKGREPQVIGVWSWRNFLEIERSSLSSAKQTSPTRDQTRGEATAHQPELQQRKRSLDEETADQSLSKLGDGKKSPLCRIGAQKSILSKFCKMMQDALSFVPLHTGNR